MRAFDEILKASAEIGGRVVVMRPINLNLAVHNNALKFAKDFAMDGRVSVIFVPSVACGRSLADFDLVWKKLELREKLIELPNVDQFYLEDLGAVFAENMSLARCPLRDIVEGRFNIAPDAPSFVRERLETIYDRAARIHIANGCRSTRRAALIVGERWRDQGSQQGGVTAMAASLEEMIAQLEAEGLTLGLRCRRARRSRRTIAASR